jgi:hypothetical protein
MLAEPGEQPILKTPKSSWREFRVHRR